MTGAYAHGESYAHQLGGVERVFVEKCVEQEVGHVFAIDFGEHVREPEKERVQECNAREPGARIPGSGDELRLANGKGVRLGKQDFLREAEGNPCPKERNLNLMRVGGIVLDGSVCDKNLLKTTDLSEKSRRKSFVLK